MSASTPPVGIDHPTVVPTNFDPEDRTDGTDETGEATADEPGETRGDETTETTADGTTETTAETADRDR